MSDSSSPLPPPAPAQSSSPSVASRLAQPSATPPALVGLDPRGPRFGAAISTFVLAAALVTLPSGLGLALLAVQTVAFAWGTVRGVAASPYGRLYRQTLRRRLPAPTELEDPRPPRFAQGVGLAFCLVGLVTVLGGATTAGLVAVSLALVAAFLNAAFSYCLGCELYLLLVRLRHVS